MAKGRKPKGYTNALDSIFGMAFGNAKTKPAKIYPRRIKAYNAQGELVKGIAEIASKPANYISEGAYAPLKEIANGINLVEFNLDNFDSDLIKTGDPSNNRIRVRGGELASFMTNPNLYIEKIFESAENERKWSAYLRTGQVLDAALITAWAKKQGFSATEAVTYGLASSNFVGPDTVNMARKKFSENVVMAAVHSRARLSNTDPKYIDPVMANQVFQALEGAKSFDLKRNPEKLEKLLSAVPGLANHPDYVGLVDQIKTTYKDRFEGEWGSFIGGDKVTDGIINRDGYIDALRENNAYKIANLNRAGTPGAKDEALKLAASNQALEVMMKIKGPGFGGRGQSEKEVVHQYNRVISDIRKDLSNVGLSSARKSVLLGHLNSLEREVKSIQYKRSLFNAIVPWGSSLSGNFHRFKKAMNEEVKYEMQDLEWKIIDETDPVKKNQLMDQYSLKQKKLQALRTLPGFEWRLYMADLQGTYGSIKSNFIDGNLGGNIVSGTFFNPAVSGFLAPGALADVQTHQYGKSSFKTGIIIPRSDSSESYAALANLYYLTPGSLAKSLFFNGEGFVYLKMLQRANLAKKLSKNGFSNNLYSAISAANFTADDMEKLKKFFVMTGNGTIAHLNAQSFSTNYLDFMESLRGKSGQLGASWVELDRLFKADQNGILGTLIRVTGAPQRAMMQIQAIYDKAVKEKVNDFIVNNFFRKFLGDSAANKLLGSGLKSLGLRQAIKIAVSEWLAGIGASIGGPIGAVAGFILTQLAEAFLEKMFKPFVKIFMAFLWFFVVVIFGLVGMAGVLAWSAVNPLPQQHIPPTDNLECAAGNPFADLYNFQTEEEPGNLPGAPADSTCPILSPIMYCTQGDGAGVSHYHSQYHGVDIGQTGLADTVWYAPTDGTVVSFSAVNYCSDGKDYGGAMIFKDSSGIEYRLLHVKSLASGRVSKGTPVAIMQTDIQVGYCWTGAHFHLDVNAGGWQDAEKWYKEKLKCNIASTGTGCG